MFPPKKWVQCSHGLGKGTSSSNSCYVVSLISFEPFFPSAFVFSTVGIVCPVRSVSSTLPRRAVRPPLLSLALGACRHPHPHHYRCCCCCCLFFVAVVFDNAVWSYRSLLFFLLSWLLSLSGGFACQVDKAKEEFKAGNLFEVVLSQTFEEPCISRCACVLALGWCLPRPRS